MNDTTRENKKENFDSVQARVASKELFHRQVLLSVDWLLKTVFTVFALPDDIGFPMSVNSFLYRSSGRRKA